MKRLPGKRKKPLRPQDRGHKALTVYVPAKLYRALKKYAYDEDRKHAEILRKLLEDHLKRAGYA